MKHDRRRVIGDCRTIMVVGIHLLPNGAIFEPDHGAALDAVNVAIDPADERVQLGPCRLTSFFGCLFSRFLDFLIRFRLGLLGRFLLSALPVTLEICIEVLDFVLAQFI